jgi:hypothetical protein
VLDTPVASTLLELGRHIIVLILNLRLFFDELFLIVDQVLDGIGLLFLAHAKKLDEIMHFPHLEHGTKALPVTVALLLGDPLDDGQPGVAERGQHGQSAVQPMVLFFVVAKRHHGST